jgi:S-adenosylmethionine decarboxylase
LFGPHLIIDGSHCDTARLADRLTIERILTDYPRAIGMTRIGGPYMFEYQAPDPAYSGVSGLVVIAESHIAIHTFPALDFFSMDIFSCKNFDHELAIEYIRKALDVKTMDRMLVQRGLSFRGPHHGPLGATDDLIAAHASRYAGLAGVTTGSIPSDDPLLTQPDAGRMLWPAYGVAPDEGNTQPDGVFIAAGARAGATVRAANAAAAGDRASPGMTPVQPVQLNPTASTSGILERLTTLGGPARRLGQAMARWEALARNAPVPVVLALGPGIVASGMRDVVADLIHRGHISALLVEGDTLCADWYESLGYRHYLTEEHGDLPVRDADEWCAARSVLNGIVASGQAIATPSDLARHVGQTLGVIAPRPGISAAAAEHRVPIFTLAGDFADLELLALDREADCAALAQMLARPGAGVVAFGTTAATSEALAMTAPQTPVIALGSAPLANPGLACGLDATIALPIMATGLAQRLPKRPAAPAQAADRRDTALARR